MDLYNKYVGNTEIDLRNAGLVERTTHIYKAYVDSLGDVHLDVRIVLTKTEQEINGLYPICVSQWMV